MGSAISVVSHLSLAAALPGGKARIGGPAGPPGGLAYCMKG